MPLAWQKRVEGGGLPIGACLAYFVVKTRLHFVVLPRLVAIRSRFGRDSVATGREFVVKTRLHFVDWRVVSVTTPKTRHKKSPNSSIEGIGLAPAAMRRYSLAVGKLLF